MADWRWLSLICEISGDLQLKTIGEAESLLAASSIIQANRARH
jgi:hypothetical protein